MTNQRSNPLLGVFWILILDRKVENTEKKIIIAGNWKMNMLREDINGIISQLDRQIGDKLHLFTKKKVVLFPSFPYLSIVVERLRNLSIEVGAQNVHYEQDGSHTGEVSAAMLKDLGVEYVLLGHSDRRIEFQENNELINRKIKIALQSGLRPLVCCGETLHEKEQGVAEMVIVDQIETMCRDLKKEEMEKITFAYEPVWAIGSGKVASPADANAYHQLIRKVIARNWGEETAVGIHILYGGSVKYDHFNSFLKQKHVDGVLIGKSSQSSKSLIRFILHG